MDRVERLGNKLPDPATIFFVGALLVVALSDVAARAGWQVEKPGTSELLAAKSLLSSEGVYFAVSSLVDNFKNFPPLAIVLVGMLGIGLAERVGFVGALLRATLASAPPTLLSPVVVFLGVMSSLAVDAGYVVLPPVAAALYAAAGRPPLAGIAAAIAGVAAGFSANLFPTGLDTLLMGFSTSAARLVDPTYQVQATANWWFMAASTVVLTGVGWAVTARFVEPRLARVSAAPPPEERTQLAESERRGLRAGLFALAALLAALTAGTLIPGAPFHGSTAAGSRILIAIVPLLFVVFFVPGLAYGVRAGTLSSDRDAARFMSETMAAMGAYIVLAFFAAQFIEYFRWSGLGEMIAISGGQLLARAALPTPLLLVAFIVVVAAVDFAIASMSAKYAFLAPVFIPMFMQVGISPELTQAAYRIGDSVTNCITPLNPYLVIALVLMRRYAPQSGIGTLLALMLPVRRLVPGRLERTPGRLARARSPARAGGPAPLCLPLTSGSCCRARSASSAGPARGRSATSR